MLVKQLNGANFKEMISRESKPVLVDFYADWCGPCKMVSPLIEQIAKENEGVAVFKVNVDECPNLAAEYSVMSIPTIISFKDSQLHKKLIGARPKNDILDLLR